MGEQQEEVERHRGVVKWFSSVKGYGFITPEDSEDEVFVHQSNIDTTGYRSLREGEEVEFDLVVGEDGKKKAFGVTGPDRAPPQGSLQPPPIRSSMGGRGEGRAPPAAYDPAAYHAAAAAAAAYGPYGDGMGMGRGGRGGAAYWAPPEATGYAMAAPGYYPPTNMAAPTPFYGAPLYPRGRGGFFPGGRNWAGARPPPPGQPGFSSGLQVVVHNLPWDCTWQQLKDAFSACGEIERADVVFDSRGRSRGFGIVRFPTQDSATMAVDTLNNGTIGGRVVSVRIDRFA